MDTCPHCGSSDVQLHWSGSKFKCNSCHKWFDNPRWHPMVEEESGRKPQGCEACGNDMYPMCKSGCNMFQD